MEELLGRLQPDQHGAADALADQLAALDEVAHLSW
jgi:hypothetical protein